jgi:hypothetical protein
MGADEMTDTLFTASAIAIAYCDKPGCRAVHLHLVDADGVTRAQAMIGREKAIDIAADLVMVADSLRGALRAGAH